jgi:hypothetical protein
MADFLFVFGYETPEEWRTNQHQGTDYESSEAVWISAENEEAALTAGRSHAERWVNDLFLKHQGEAFPGWIASGYAHWIEHEPLGRFSAMDLDSLDRIQG